MSSYAISAYYKEVEKLKHYGGTNKETAIRNAFYTLLNDYAKAKDLQLVAEVTIKSKYGANISPDGTLKDMLRQDWGYWESKDEYDDLDLEIQKKFDKGYPNENILFEDGKIAVLYQMGREVARIDMQDKAKLDKLIKTFVSYERPEVKEFHKAIELFKTDIPKVTEALRNLIINVAEREDVGQLSPIDQTQDKYVVPPSGGFATTDCAAGLVILSSVEMSDKTGHVLASSFDSAQDDSERSKQNRINAELYTEKDTQCLRDSVSLNSIPKTKLKADKEQGIIFIDEVTTLRGIPSEAWQYRLGNRSALEWILDQYKEKKPKDPTIAKLFNTYKFADYKEQVIDLLLRATVSLKTMKIIQEMEQVEIG